MLSTALNSNAINVVAGLLIPACLAGLGPASGQGTLVAAWYAGLTVLALALAVGIVYSRFLERTVYTLLVALNSIPKVALAPLFVIWMGTGPEPKVAIALMLAQPSMIKRPVLDVGGKLLVGFKPEQYATTLGTKS